METMTIQIRVSPELVARCGTEALTERVQQILEWDELSFKAQKMNPALQEARIDFDTMAEEIRKEACDEYKHKIEDKLPPEAFE